VALFNQADKFIDVNGFDWSVRRYAEHVAELVPKDHMTPAGLSVNHSEGFSDRDQVFDAPITRIGFHLFKRFRRPFRHCRMILGVTLRDKRNAFNAKIKKGKVSPGDFFHSLTVAMTRKPPSRTLMGQVN
jgi:hypothetical protein